MFCVKKWEKVGIYSKSALILNCQQEIENGNRINWRI